MAISENVATHLSWIATAARDKQLVGLEVTDVNTGEPRVVLALKLDTEKEFEFYPLALMFEDMGEAMLQYQPVITGASNDDRKGADNSDERPPGTDT